MDSGTFHSWYIDPIIRSGHVSESGIPVGNVGGLQNITWIDPRSGQRVPLFQDTPYKDIWAGINTLSLNETGQPLNPSWNDIVAVADDSSNGSDQKRDNMAVYIDQFLKGGGVAWYLNDVSGFKGDNQIQFGDTPSDELVQGVMAAQPPLVTAITSQDGTIQPGPAVQPSLENTIIADTPANTPTSVITEWTKAIGGSSKNRIVIVVLIIIVLIVVLRKE